MKRIFSIVLLGFGIVLLVAGVGSADSIGSEICRLFTAPPPDKAMWFMIGGVLCVGLGATGLFDRRTPASNHELESALKTRRSS